MWGGRGWSWARQFAQSPKARTVRIGWPGLFHTESGKGRDTAFFCGTSSSHVGWKKLEKPPRLSGGVVAGWLSLAGSRERALYCFWFLFQYLEKGSDGGVEFLHVCFPLLVFGKVHADE